jgi:hypothetical protein
VICSRSCSQFEIEFIQGMAKQDLNAAIHI